MDKKIIGRKERIHLPEWRLKNIIAKVDTGAYSNSIHCEYIEKITKGDKEVLRFTLLSPKDRKYNGLVIETENFTQKKVKNSFGHAEMRYKVSTKIKIFQEEIATEFTLTNRGNMRNSILLGRKVIAGKFLVDVQKVNLSKKPKL
jgi:hypothetical protein